MPLHPHCLSCLPLHVQPNYISHALILDSPSSQASLEAKPPNSSWFQVKGLEQQWVRRSPLVLQDPCTINGAVPSCLIALVGSGQGGNAAGEAHPKFQAGQADFPPCQCLFPLSSCHHPPCCVKLADTTTPGPFAVGILLNHVILAVMLEKNYPLQYNH